MGELLRTNYPALFKLEGLLKEMPQADTVTDHHFCESLYARTLTIPAGTILTGAIHKSESFFVVRAGLLLVTPDNMNDPVGPGFMSVTRAGDKRAIVALTDSVITTIHPNPENVTDPDTLWNMYTIDPEEVKI